ncbi:hypothetical protein [Methanolapillus africanus]
MSQVNNKAVIINRMKKAQKPKIQKKKTKRKAAIGLPDLLLNFDF